MEFPTTKVIQSFNISFKGTFLLSIQHTEKGLLPGTLLISKISNLNWEVLNRQLCYKIKCHKRFPGEKEHFSYCNLLGSDDPNALEKSILDSEGNNIFKYEVKPINDDLGPKKEELLTIQFQNLKNE